MASNIVSTTINENYPIAGQDNDSQGFRDNFTNLKNNFTEAQTEINDLQSKVVVKSALTGTTINNDFAGSVMKAAETRDIRETVVAQGTTSGTVTLNYASGPYHTVTSSGNITLAFSNLPATGKHGKIRIAVTVANVSHTLTFPSAVSQGTSGLQGISSQTITFATTGTYIFEFSTSNGGTTIHVTEISRPRSTYMNGITAPSITLTSFAQLPVLSSAPSSPVNGQVVVSDGTGWNPHSTGQQEVSAYINGGWVKLS